MDISDQEKIGETFFKLRDYTPIPLILLMFWLQTPTAVSATVGIFAIIFGELVRIYGVAFIGSISRTRKGSLGSRLITGGPFRYVRNPLYVGNFFITIGFAIFSGNFLFFLLSVIGFAVQYVYIVQFEEKLLAKTYGEEFDEYCRQVPRWVPNQSVQIEELEWPDTWGEALVSEKRTLTTIVVVLVLSLIIGR